MFFRDSEFEQKNTRNKQGQSEDTIARKMRQAEERWREEEREARYRKVEDDIAVKLHKKKLEKKYKTNNTRSQLKWFLGVPIILMIFFAFMDQVDKPDALDKERIRRSMKRGFNVQKKRDRARAQAT